MVQELIIPMGQIDGDDQQWQYLPPGVYDGLYFPLGVYVPLATRWEAAPKTISVRVGDTVRITASVKYRGPAKTYILYGAIGAGRFNTGTGSDTGDFDEGAASTRTFEVTESDTYKSYNPTVEVKVPANTGAPLWISLDGKKAAVYVKITDGIGLELDKTLSPYYRGALDIAPKAGEFGELKITDYVKV